MLKPHLTDYIYVQNILPKDFCAKVISENVRSDEWREHSWSYAKEPGNIQYTSGENELLVKGVSEKNTEKTVMGYVEHAMAEYLKSMLQNETLPNIQYFSGIRINRYITGSDMKKHHDCIISLFEKGCGIPSLSIVGVLNDDYGGGDFIMFDNMRINLNAGDILIFPSTFAYTHEVKTVTKGERWSFVSWAY